MPPHLPKSLYLTTLPLRPSPIHLPFLRPQLQACRLASILSSLSDNPTAFSQPHRLGRGPSSGRGKTSTRGHKGQKQHGKVPRGFNGGQTKDEVVSGKRGDHNFASFQETLTPLNLSTLTTWIRQNRIDPTHPITIRELLQSRCVSNVKDGVKLLAKTSNGTSSQPHAPLPAMNVVVSRASASAIAAIEAAGGSVTTRYYTPFAVRQIARGNMDPVNSLQSRIAFADQREQSSMGDGAGVEEAMAKKEEGFRYRLPDPTSRKDIEYYRDPAKRGYLSWMVPEGQGPSLFYKTPGTGRIIRKSVKGGKGEGENRIW